MRRALSSLARDESGASLAEAAIILPVFLVMSLSALEFGHIFYQFQNVTTGVRDAARYLARAPLADTANPTCDEAITFLTPSAKNLAIYGNIAGTGKPRVYGWGTGNVAIATTQITTNSGGTTYYRGPDGHTCLVRVSTSFPYRSFGLLGAFKVLIPNIGVAHTERWIGG